MQQAQFPFSLIVQARIALKAILAIMVLRLNALLVNTVITQV